MSEPQALSTPNEITSAATRIKPANGIATASLILLNCAEDNSGLPIIPGGEYQGWCRYMDGTYEFALAVPPNWSVRTAGVNFLYVFPQDSPDTSLTMSFRRVTEDALIRKTGVGAGEIATESTVNFLGEQISRNVLVYEENVKAVRYNHAAETQRDQLVFTLSLDDWSTDYESVSLSPEIQATADRIVESITLEQ
jgi:hypothetical protein